MTTRLYTILLKPDPEQGGYWVEVPTFPGCYSQGDTLDEALANIREAIEGYIETLVMDGEPIPEEPVPYQVQQIEIAA